MRCIVVGLLASLAACDDTPTQFRIGDCDASWNTAFNGQHPQYCETACHAFVAAQSSGCAARTFRSVEVSCAFTFAWDGEGVLAHPLAQPLIGCCIKGTDTPDDPAEQFAVCET